MLSELRRRSALEEMIQQNNATQKLFRQEFLKGTYDLMKVLYIIANTNFFSKGRHM